ncbi:endonuclease-reverse transcriptase [Lasius niger]|uniref:Endonuclease-reverse transcriptase n=1 Tax=Lasius niger TaxID=67767 RepID=A0A0J7K831_LASNI|nr:endonuclease-reverse transcriptase [Lasius niger]
MSREVHVSGLNHLLELELCSKVMLYGVEAWTMTDTLMRKLEAFEMWVYRRILRISWTQHIYNEEVFRRMGKEKEGVFMIKRRKEEGRWKKRSGKKREFVTVNLCEWFGLTSVQLFRQAVNKVRIAMLIANVRRE